MVRVLRPGGRLVVTVCDALDHSLGYSALAELLHRLFGADVAQAFRAPFALGDSRELRQLCERAGVANAEIAAHEGTVRFDSIDALVGAERACAWTLGGLLNDAQFERLCAEAQRSLLPFATEAGVAFEMPALLIGAHAAARKSALAMG